MFRITKRWWLFFLTAIAITYFVLAFHNLLLPGVYYDELLQVLPALSAAGYNVGDEFYQVPRSIIHFGNIRLPLMIMPYTGPFETFIFTPLFFVLPPTVTVLRSTFIFLGIITIAFTFFATREVFGLYAAIIASLLLATDAGYIFYSRADIGPINTMMIIKTLMLLTLTLWWRSGKRYWFYVGAFLGGLGIYDKANFVWLLIAGGLVISVFGFKELMERLRHRWKMLFVGSLIFLIGAGPFIVYVLLSGGGPFKSFIANFENTGLGINNLNIMQNLGRRAISLWGLLNGYLCQIEYTSCFSCSTDHGIVSERWFVLQPYALLLAVAAPILLYLRQRILIVHLKIILGLAILISLILLLSIFTPTTLSNNHLLLIYPFPHILIAYAAVLIWSPIESPIQNAQTHITRASISKTSRIMRGAVTLVILLTLIGNFLATIHVHRALETTGGIGMWSSAIYELNDYLESQNRDVVCMDWGLCYNLLFLSQGRLKTTDQWRQFLYPNSNHLQKLETLLQGNNLFVFHSPTYTGILEIVSEDYPRQTFFQIARELTLRTERNKMM